MNRLTLSPDHSLKVLEPHEITDEILENFLECYEESHYANVSELTKEGANEIIYGFTTNPDTVCIVLYKERKPIGHIVGQLVHQHPFILHKKGAFELTWWVHKKHRGTRHSFRLLDAFEYWARLNKCDYISVGTLSNSMQETLDKVYTKRGFLCVEKYYMKELT